MTGVDPAVDDGPDDPVPAGVVGAPGRVDLHGRRRTVDLGRQGVVRPDPEDDRGKPAVPGGAADLPGHLLRVGAGQDALVELGRNQREPRRYGRLDRTDRRRVIQPRPSDPNAVLLATSVDGP